METLSVLIIDGVPATAHWERELFRCAGFEVSLARTTREGLQRLAESPFDLILLDHFLEDSDGHRTVRQIRRDYPGIPVLVMNQLATVPAAMASLREGASYYLCKPIDPFELQLAVTQALAPRRFAGDFSYPRDRSEVMAPLSPIVGESECVKQVRAMIVAAAHSTCPVLVHGPSGTGKEVITRSIHDLSTRRDGPFIAVNCGALPEGLAESELFGAEKGAFTGAGEASKGLFRAAHGGTIFLDELAEMPVSMQVKLLRVLQEGTIRRVGGTTEVPVDARVIAATNSNPQEAMDSGNLRDDLFYRVAVLQIEMLPLGDRPEDVEPLCEVILERLARRLGREPPRLTDAALDVLLAHPWPGNVRELENALEYVFALGVVTDELDRCHLPPSLVETGEGPGAPGSAGLSDRARQGITTLKAAEQSMIRRALIRTKGNKARAAELLGITRSYLYRRLREMDALPGQD